MKTFTRRGLLDLILVGTAACVLATEVLPGEAPPAAKKNVLFIAVDDLRPQLGCYGKRQVLSPNIDKLAARGTLFEHAYCQQAVCSPSRTSLLTGCRPDTTKVYDLETHFRKTIPDVVTLPQYFKKHGYHTQGFSKIYHGGLDDAESWSVPHWQPKGPQYQLKENMQLIRKRIAELPDEDAKVKAARRSSIRGMPFECADVADNAYADGATADEAIRVLRDVKDKPFFLAVGFLKPHLPFVAPRKYWDLYKREDIPLADNPYPPKDSPKIAWSNWAELRAYEGMPRTGSLGDDQARELIHGYLACVSYTDAQVGRVLDELDRAGLRDNTIIVLWGDHGWKLGEHGMWCKHTNYELDANAPLILSAPGQKAAGRKTSGLVEFVDIYPTLCELAGLPRPEHLEGASFAPLLDDPEKPWKKAAFSQYPRGKVMGYTMRTDRYRFTRWQNPDGSALAAELYDHQKDPKENVNIAGLPENAKLVEDLTAQLKAGWRAAKPQ
ncbi:MAG: sulfatase [Planctomycetota bacterium]|nr:sulfatase [Planctomycetota bacterium]